MNSPLINTTTPSSLPSASPFIVRSDSASSALTFMEPADHGGAPITPSFSPQAPFLPPYITLGAAVNQGVDSGEHLLPAGANPLLPRAPDFMSGGGSIDWASLLQLLQPAPAVTAPAGGNLLVEGAQARAGDGAGGGKEKGKRGKSKMSRPRFAFRTKSPNDILDDGYRWRKYGQKAVKNSSHPRSYYRCTHHTCNVKKQIQRLSKDTTIVVTTYEGIHNHPCEKLMEALAPLLKQLQFLTSF